eukprot:jgi/Hompol1/1470/HPOL_000346-RA
MRAASTSPVKSSKSSLSTAAVAKQPSAQSNAGPPEQTQWPEALTNYCRRVLGDGDGEKNAGLQARLKQLIVHARKIKALWTTDWDKMPVPTTTADIPLIPLSSSSDNSSSQPSAAQPSKKQDPSASQLESAKRTASWSLSNQPSKPTPASVESRLGSRLGSRVASPAPHAASAYQSNNDDPTARREERLKRFKTDHDAEAMESYRKQQEIRKAQAAFINAGAEGNPDVIDWDEDTIVGTSTKLEKSYLRLTSAPDPTTVRPINILRQTLELLKTRWKEDRNYTYICDQFKSLRQDLTVQRIKSDLTVQVYETHARIALEMGDLGEYNQCQAQLKQLYGIYKLSGCTDEFIAYRILYMLHTMNKRDLINILTELTPEAKNGACVRHALAVRSAIAMGDFHSLFTLYYSAPKMSGYLMDQFIERERQSALRTLLKSYMPSISVAFVTTTLGFVPQSLARFVEHVATIKTGTDLTTTQTSLLDRVNTLAAAQSLQQQANAGPGSLSSSSTSSAASGQSQDSQVVPMQVDSQPTLSKLSQDDLDTICSALSQAETWLRSMNVVWEPLNSADATSAPQTKLPPTPAPPVAQSANSRKLRKHAGVNASNGAAPAIVDIPRSTTHVSCKQSVAIVAEKARATFAKGVDIKGQIH